MTKRKDLDAEVKKHLNKIWALDGGWQVMLDILQRRGIQRQLREERIVQGVTQAQLADRMGVSQGRISELESERYPDLRIDTLSRWAFHLDLEFQMRAIPLIVEDVDQDEGSDDG